MRNKVKRTLSFLLTFVMLCSLLPAMALAKEPEGRYEEVAGVGALVNDAQVHVFTTKGAGNIELTGINKVETTFPQGSGYREYTATTNEGWVFDTWRYEQLQNGEDLGNREDEWFGTRYSFTNSGDNWRDPYTEGNTTISVNRLTTHGEVAGKPIIYNIYADFNPTITATAGDNGTIFNGEKPVDAKEPVEVEYGKDQTFEIKANDGYVIDTIKVDGNVVEENVNKVSDTYTFENVAEPHNIDVTFRKTEVGECTVTYEVFGEFPADYVIPESVTVNEGDIYTVADVPPNVTTDEGTYTFKGWYNGEIKVGDTIEVTSDVTLTGTWTFDGKDDVWNAVYGSIRVYMDEGTEADFDNLPGFNLNKQVRLYSEKYLTDGYRLCGYEPINDFWYTTNAKGVTARDISEIVLAKDKLVGSSEKISIPMTGNDDYQVIVSEGKDKFGLIPYTYLKIEISKKEPVAETVTLTYEANGGEGAPASTTVNKNTEDYVLNTDTTPTHVAVGGREVEFKGWSADEAVINQVYEKNNVYETVTTIDIAEENVTVYAVWAYGDPVDPVDPPEPPTWELSKDKTATALDSNYNSKVTLSLPAGDYPQTVDVVFTVDCTSVLLYNYTGIIKEIEKIADELVGKDINLNVGLVGFGHESKVYLPLTNITEENVDAVMEEVKTTISNDRDWLKNNGGTNIQKGILTGRELLDNSNTGALPNDQYFILMTDGAGFWYNNANGETVCTAHRDSNQSLGNMDANNDVGGPTRINDSMYLRAVNEGKTFGDFIAEQGAAIEKSAERSFTTEGAKSAGELAYTTQDVQNYDVYPYLNMERGTYFAAKALQDVAAEGYSVITIGYNYNKFGLTSLNAVSKGFREWTAEVGSYYTASMFNVQDAFEGVRDEMIYLLDAGSQVVDIIGQGKDNKGNDYNFDVVNLENMTITVGGVKQEKTEISDNKYGFGTILDNDKYPFVVTYYPNGTDAETREHFVWDINVPVSNFAPVQFSYDVQLTNPQKAKGEYKVETNVEAVLTPVDSNKEPGKPEKFPVPELTYEVKGGGSTTEHLMTVIVEGKGNVVVKDVQTVGANDTEVVEIPFGVEKQKFEMEAADGWKLDKVEVTINGKTENLGDVDKYEMDESLIDGAVLKAVFVKDNDGGSGGGGSHRPNNKPDETPEALNGDDHFDYVVGYSDGLVHPERNITRAEVASIFFRLLQDDVREKNLTDQNPFNDVFTDDWFNVAVSTMYDMDIVYGRDNNNFDPNAYITRAEFAAIAARFDSEGYSGENLFTDIDGHWAANQINRAAEKGWISGYPDGTFGPDRYITRAEAVTMINRVLNRLPESADALHEDMNVFPDNMDTTAWYYLAIQEATSSHEYEKDKDGVYETWTDVLPDRDWAQYLKLN